MALRNHPNITHWPLSGNGGGQVQTWEQGQPMSWLMRTLPKLADNGTKVNYLLGFCVTIIGSFTHVHDPGIGCYADDFKNPGSATARSSVRTMWDVIRMLIGSVEVRSAWHGTPLSAGHVKGSMLQLLEFVGNGLETPYRQKPVLVCTASPSTQYFRYSFFLPMCLLAGQKGHHTALPAVFYKDAELVINAASKLNPFGGTTEYDSLGATTFKVSAVLLPESEIRVGPGMEWIDYKQVVNGNAYDLAGLGTVTTLDRVKPGSGLAGLFWLSNRNGLPGAGMVRDINSLAVPFLDIPQSTHLDPIIQHFESVVGGRALPLGPATASADGDGDPGEGATDFCGLPYDDFDRGTSENGSGNASAQSQPNPLWLAFKVPPKDFETSKLTFANGSQQVQLEPATEGMQGRTHHTLALQFRAWTPEAWTSALQLLISEGITKSVLNTDDVEWSLKTLRKQNPLAIPPSKRAFFAMALRPKKGAQAAVR